MLARSLSVLLLSALLLVSVCEPAAAQEDAAEPRPNAQREDRDRGDARRGRMDQGNMLERLMRSDPSQNLISILSQLNMTPDFTLTVDQKTKIQELRETYTRDMGAFIEENRRKFEFIRIQAQEAMAGGDGNAVRAAWQDARDLAAQGPDGGKLNDDIKAVLTDDQRAVVDQKLQEQAERWQRWREQRDQRREQREDDGPTI